MTLSLLQILDQYFKPSLETEEHFIEGTECYCILQNAYVIHDKMFCKVTVEIRLFFASLQFASELNWQFNNKLAP